MFNNFTVQTCIVKLFEDNYAVNLDVVLYTVTLYFGILCLLMMLICFGSLIAAYFLLKIYIVIVCYLYNNAFYCLELLQEFLNRDFHRSRVTVSVRNS